MRVDTRRIKIRMAELELTQTLLAKKMGFTKANMSKYVQGQIVTFRALERMASFLKISPLDLLIDD